MAELKRYTFRELMRRKNSEIVSNADEQFYLATEADRRMLELELALWNARATLCMYRKWVCISKMNSCKVFEDDEFHKQDNMNDLLRIAKWKCRHKANEIRKKLEEMK